MSRQDYEYSRTQFSKGINEDAESSSPEELADARNLWRPGSRIENRPGYIGVGYNAHSSGLEENVTMSAAKSIGGSVTNDAAGGLTIAGLDATKGDFLAFGHTAAINGFQAIMSVANTANMGLRYEYYNGTRWMPLHVTAVFSDATYTTNTRIPFGSARCCFFFAAPADWAVTTLGTAADKYWLKISLVETDGVILPAAELTAGTRVQVGATKVYPLDTTGVSRTTDAALAGMVGMQFPSSHRYATIQYSVAVTSQATLSTHERPSLQSYTDSTKEDDLTLIGAQERAGVSESPWIADPPTVAVVPQFDEAFVAFDSTVSRIPAVGAAALATPEVRDFAVGDRAPYDDDYIVQQPAFPRCSYIKFFAGRLWATGIAGQPYTVQWSAAAPYHKVWPALSFEYLMEDDNSPITGMAPLGEHMVIFKRDSIWIMIPTELNPATEVFHFVPKKIVDGVGCVSNASIQQIRGQLIFLSENGIYAFNGSPNIRKVTENNIGADRLQDTIASIRAGRFRFAVSTHWREQEHYLLAINNGQDGDENNRVIAWNYHQDSWWVWDGIKARGFLNTEGAFDREILYFFDQNGRIYRMKASQTDHGGTITAYGLSQRYGFGDIETQTARSTRICSDNTSRALTIETYVNDKSQDTGTVDLTDVNEKDWSSFTFGTDSYITPARRVVREDLRATGEWIQVKFTHNTKGERFRMSYLDLGLQPEGNR